MALRKFMHSKNKYKKAPDFKQLAILYPEFRKVARTDLTGKVRIDFKNQDSVRILTKTLLKHDFDLDVDIPQNKLVPTLPLRLNYVLWVDDLLNHARSIDTEFINGIDIGTGAVCIYPLLFAKIYGYHMTATEVDEESCESASLNIKKNNLQHLVTVRKVKDDEMLQTVLDDNKIYHFTMCNPPFFETDEDVIKISKELPARNAPTGTKGELCVQGGEKTFVMKMIDDSLVLKDQIKIYTTMLGHKSNLISLIKQLKKKNIENISWTEFCQGYTTRWGLAWTFLPKTEIDLSDAPTIRKRGNFITKFLKDRPPMEIVFPVHKEISTIERIILLLRQGTRELNMHVQEINIDDDSFDGWACKLSAKEDTWSHARRKRRLAQRQGDTSKRFCAERSGERESVSLVTKEMNSDSTPLNDEITDNEKTESEEPLLEFSLYVEIIDDNDVEENSFKLHLIFERGSGGRNSLETFRQYLINKLNVREHMQQQSVSNKKRKSKKRKDLKPTDDDEEKSC